MVNSPEEMKFSSDLKEEIAQAFLNVDLALKDAGGEGLSQVQPADLKHPQR